MRAVEIAREGLRPSQILTAEAFDNAITTLMAIGGGTNAVIHLLALAGRVDVPLTLERFDELSRRTPLIANVRPSGEHLVEHLHRAGGIRAVLHELAPLLHADALTITGRTLGEETAEALPLDRELIRPLDDPLASEGGHRRPAREPRARRRDHQAQRGLPGAALASRAGRRVRGHLRRRRADRRSRRSRSPPTPSSCCATPARREARGCRNGERCRSRSGCSSRA